MFDNTCTECGKHYLIFPSQVTGMANTGGDIVVEFVCWCGADQTWHAHGEHRTPVAA